MANNRFPLLTLPSGVRPARWRKHMGVGITHHVARKARAIRYADSRGVRK